MKEARKFSREQPCTKVEIHNCFFDGRQYTKRPVVEVKMEVGDNVPKYLVREDYVSFVLLAGVDYYELTVDGEEWLRAGLKRYLELHPERASDVVQAATGRVIRRQASTPTPTTAKAPSRVVRRTMR